MKNLRSNLSTLHVLSHFASTRSVQGNQKHDELFANRWLKFKKKSFMLLNYISSEQSVKILVKSLRNCKSYEHLHDGVSAFTEHVEN